MATSSTMALATDMEEEGKCSICMDYPTDLVSVACGHNFCWACVTKHCKTWGELEGGDLVCLLCRTWIQRENFQSNSQLANTVEKFRLVPLKLGKENLCVKHKKPLNLFCKVDRELMCVACKKSPEHKEHTALLLQDSAQKYKVPVWNWLATLKEDRENILAYKAETEKEQQELLKRIKLEKESMTSEFRWLQQFLEEQEDFLLDEMEEVEKEIAWRMEKHLAKLSEDLSSLQSLIQEMEAKLHQETGELLQDIRGLLQRCEKKETFEYSVVFPPALRWKVLDFCDVNPFLENVMEQFKATLQSGLQLQKAKVTLDPDTAHPQLILSEVRKGVRYRDQKQDLPGNSERFDLCPYVLGHEGFTTGRHFWEVLLEGEEWAVGVARRSLRRNGAVFSVSENRIWEMGKWGDQYWTSKGPYDLVLPLREMPQRIRVILNYEGGRVAFYNAENLNLITEFLAEEFLGEEVRPLFLVADDAQLMLSL